MFYVYILQSEIDPSRIYIGKTNNIKRRLEEHNSSPTCSYTKKHKPWMIKSFIAFKDEQKAGAFEIYLKSHSGKAFLQKHFL